jgi:hypothetical protein
MSAPHPVTNPADAMTVTMRVGFMMAGIGGVEVGVQLIRDLA